MKSMKQQLMMLCCLILFAIYSCKKDDGPKARYTIQGRVYLSYPSRPLAKQSITVTFTAGHASSYESIDLGDATTDDSGYFSISYDALDMSNRSNVDIHIFNQFLQIDGIPINQNVNKNFFIPTSGTVEVYLQTNNPLQTNHDTLFLGHYAGNTPIIDTLVNANNGLYKTYKVPVGGFGIFYGRGWNKFNFDPSIQKFTSSKNRIDISISGDPIIDKMIINY